MKFILAFVACIVLAGPAVAQDVDLGLGGDPSSLLNLPTPLGNAPAARGCGNAAPAIDRLARLRELFASSNLALSKEQETAPSALLNAEIPAMRRALQERIAALQKREEKSCLRESVVAFFSSKEEDPVLITMKSSLLRNDSVKTVRLPVLKEGVLM